MSPEDLLDPERLTLVVLLVAILIMFVRGWIVPGWAYKERDEEAAHQRDQRDELLTTFQSEVIPALVRATDALEKSSRVLERHLGNGR